MNIILDKGLKSRPPVVVADSIVGFELARMASSRMVMEGTYNITLKSNVLGDVVLALIEEDSFTFEFFSGPVSKIISKGCWATAQKGL
jgi:hypothetical protein